MAITQEEKDQLIRLKQSLQLQRSQPEYKEYVKLVDELDLSYISPEDLKSLCNPIYVVGVDFKSIDTSPPFTTTHMNEIAPGAINVRELKMKLTNKSILLAKTTDLVDTQQGVIVSTEELLANADIEDLVSTKTMSQGTNLQMVNAAENIDPEKTSSKQIKSRFVEENNG